MDAFRDLLSLLSYFVLPLILVGFPCTGSTSGCPYMSGSWRGRRRDSTSRCGSFPTSWPSCSRSQCSARAAPWISWLARSTPVTGLIGFPGEVIPMAIVRPLTGSGSAAIVVDMINQYGEDSLLVKMAAVMFGSTETTFYVIAVYFGAVNIKRTRHAVAAGLTADFAAMIIAVWTVRLLFG